MNGIDFFLVADTDWNGLSTRWILTLGHFLWEGALIGLVMAAALGFGRRASPQVRHGICLTSLLLLIPCLAVTFAWVEVEQLELPSPVPETAAISELPADRPLVDIPSTALEMPIPLEASQPWNASNSLPQEVVSAPPLPIVEADVPEPTLPAESTLSQIAPWIAVAYLIGVIALLFRTGLGLWGGQRLRAASERIQDSSLLAMIVRQAELVGLKSAPVVAYCNRVAVPTVIGIFKPMVLLPATLATGLEPNQMAAILSHELAHIRRYDLLVNLIQRCVESLLFFHPVVWWISRRLSIERENCCDDLAAASGFGEVQYAGALLRMAELSAQSRRSRSVVQVTALSAEGSSPSQLSRRIERLLNMHSTPRLAVSRMLSLSAVCVFALSVAVVGVWAQLANDKNDAGDAIAATEDESGQAPDEAKTTDDPQPVWSQPIVAPPGAWIGETGPFVLDNERVLIGKSILDLKTGEPLGELKFENVHPYVLRLSSNRRFLLVFGEFTPPQNDRRVFTFDDIPYVIQVWDLSAQKQIGSTIALEQGFAFGGRFATDITTDGKTVMTGHSDQVVVWDVPTGKKLRTAPGNIRRGVDAVAISPDRNWLAISESNSMTFWKWQTDEEPKQVEVGRTILTLAFSPDSRYLAEGPDSRTNIQIRDLQTMQIVHKLRDDAGSPLTPRGMRFSADGKTFFAANGVTVDETKLRIPHRLFAWELSTGQLKTMLPTPGRYAGGMDVSPGGRYMAVRLDNLDSSVVAVWDLEDASLGSATEILQRAARNLGLDWGLESNGLRCWVSTPAFPDPDVEPSFYEDVKFVVELQNVSDKPITLIGVRRYAKDQPEFDGKPDPAFFAPHLFEFEFFDAEGKPIPRTSRAFLDQPYLLNSAQSHEIAPGKTLQVELTPAAFHPPMDYRFPPGMYRMKVHYRGPNAKTLAYYQEHSPDQPRASAWSGDAVSNEIAFVVPGDVSKTKPLSLVWGEANDGLQAAVEFRALPGSEEFNEPPGILPNPRVSTIFHVKNVSDRTITFVSETARQGDECIATDEAGDTRRLQNTWISGIPIMVRWTLEPGEVAELRALTSGIGLIGTPGKYTLRYGINFRGLVQNHGEGESGFPKPTDYQHVLYTGDTPITIRSRTNGNEQVPDRGESTSPAPKPDEEKTTVSGRIVVEDGSPATVKGWMYYDVRGEHSSVSGTVDQFTDSFSTSLPTGTLWLSYYPEGYAPAWVGPLELKSGEPMDDIRIVLKPGVTGQVKVIDENGEPISDATLIDHPEINGKADGPIREKKTDVNGACLLEHLADTRYTFRVSAPGYETLRTEPLKIDADDVLLLTMTRSQPATGVILNSDGTPSAGAKLRAKYEMSPDRQNVGYADEGDGFWGKVFATTDGEGRFAMDQLTSGSHYLFIIEASDGTRAIVHELQAGQEDVKITLPERRDLIVKVTGDLSDLPKRRGKPYVSVRQRIEFEPIEGDRTGELVGTDIPLEVTEHGGTATLHGLAVDLKPNAAPQKLEVRLGYDRDTMQTVDLNSSGDTKVEFVLPEKQSQAVPENAAITVGEDGIYWSTTVTDGFRSGARLVAKEGRITAGEPLEIQYLLKNETDITQSLDLVRSSPAFPGLEEGNRIDLSLFPAHEKPQTRTLQAGEVWDESQNRVSIDTTGFPAGKYVVSVDSFFLRPDPEDSNRKTGIPIRGSISVIVDSPISEVTKPDTPATNRNLPDDIAWGIPVAGLQVGSRFIGQSQVFDHDTEPQVQLFVRNTTIQSIDFKVLLPHPNDGWLLNVKDDNGDHVMLERTYLSLVRPQESYQLTLKPGETVPLTGVERTVNEASSMIKNATFGIAREKPSDGFWNGGVLVSNGGQYRAIWTVSLQRSDIPGLRLRADAAALTFQVNGPELKEEDARPITLHGFNLAPYRATKNREELQKTEPILDRNRPHAEGGSWRCWLDSAASYNQWLVCYDPGQQIFYVVDEKSEEKIVYGPIPGDAIEKLRLLDGSSDLVAAKADEQNVARAANLHVRRIQSLLESHDSSLQFHGLKAFVELGDLKIYELRNWSERIEKVADSEAGRDQLKPLVGAAEKYLQDQRDRIEALKVKLDDSEYKPGREPTQTELEAEWGPVSEGLVLAIADWPRDVRKFDVNEQPQITLLVRNAGESPQRISTLDVLDGVGVIVTDEQTNQSARLDFTHFTGLARTERYLLQPGELVEIKQFSFQIKEGDLHPPGKTYNPRNLEVMYEHINVRPNRTYRLDVTLSMPSAYNSLSNGKITMPAKGEFDGQLMAKSVRLALRDADKDQDQASDNTTASLSGRIVYDGEPPAPKNLDLLRDAKGNLLKNPSAIRVQLNKLGIPDESLIVDKNGGIANVIVWVTSKEISGRVKAENDAPPVTIRAKFGQFAPHALAFWNVSSLKFINNMQEPVNLNWKPPRSTPYNVLVPSGSDYLLKVNRPERIPVPLRSDFNPWMKAYVLPLDHPFFSVTKSDGRFEIKDLPKGTWKFAIWHERVGWLKTEKYPTGRFELEVGDAPIELGDVLVDPETLADKPSKSDDKPKATDGPTNLPYEQTPQSSAAPIKLRTIRLLNGLTDQPLSGITIRTKGAVAGKEELEWMEFVSDQNGLIEIPVRDAPPFTGDADSIAKKQSPEKATIIVSGFEIVTQGWFQRGPTVIVEEEERTKVPEEPYDYKLWPGQTVTGRLQFPDESPADGVLLNVGVYINHQEWKKRLGMDLRFYSFDHGDWPNWSTRVVTNDDGTFSATVPPENSRMWVRVGTSALGFGAIRNPEDLDDEQTGRALRECVPFEAQIGGHDSYVPVVTSPHLGQEEDGVLNFGDLQLKAGVEVRGRVVDAEGNGLEGVILTTQGLHGPHSGRSTRSRENGEFNFLPIEPGSLTIRPDARLRAENGQVSSRDVQAVFVDQTYPVIKGLELVVKAVLHVELEFDWIDRRAEEAPVSYYGRFIVNGYYQVDESQRMSWRGETNLVERDGRKLLVVKVPRDLIDAKLHLSQDRVVTASYEDETGKTSGPGAIELGDVTKPLKRTIFGDEPLKQ